MPAFYWFSTKQYYQTMSFIEIDHFSYSYPAADRSALSNISLQIDEGEFVAVIGANNAGKSTLCHALVGVVPQLYHGKMEGIVRICGKDTAETKIADLAMYVSFVMQKVQNQLSGIRFTVREEVAFSLENQGLERTEIQSRVDEALQVMDLSDLAQRSPHHLSGGQLQRVALAAAFACDTPVIVLDEPTTFLDPLGVNNIFEILQKLQEKGKTIVLAEQRLECLAMYADRVIALNKGEVVLDGKSQEVLGSNLLKGIGLDWTRFTHVSSLAMEAGCWTEGKELATTLAGVINGLES